MLLTGVNISHLSLSAKLDLPQGHSLPSSLSLAHQVWVSVRCGEDVGLDKG